MKPKLAILRTSPAHCRNERRWKRVLTAAERTQLYNSGAGLDYPFP